MLRKFFMWRAERRMGRSSYRMDKRHYQGVFKPGFFAHLSHTRFWQTDNDPFQRSRKRKRKAIFIMSVIVIILLGWMILESSRAMKLF